MSVLKMVFYPTNVDIVLYDPTGNKIIDQSIYTRYKNKIEDMYTFLKIASGSINGYIGMSGYSNGSIVLLKMTNEDIKIIVDGESKKYHFDSTLISWASDDITKNTVDLNAENNNEKETDVIKREHRCFRTLYVDYIPIHESIKLTIRDVLGTTILSPVYQRMADNNDINIILKTTRGKDYDLAVFIDVFYMEISKGRIKVGSNFSDIFEIFEFDVVKCNICDITETKKKKEICENIIEKKNDEYVSKLTVNVHNDSQHHDISICGEVNDSKFTLSVDNIYSKSVVVRISDIVLNGGETDTVIVQGHLKYGNAELQKEILIISSHHFKLLHIEMDEHNIDLEADFNNFEVKYEYKNFY